MTTSSNEDREEAVRLTKEELDKMAGDVWELGIAGMLTLDEEHSLQERIGTATDVHGRPACWPWTAKYGPISTDKLRAALEHMDIGGGRIVFDAIEAVFKEAAERSKKQPERFRENLAHGFDRLEKNIGSAKFMCLTAIDMAECARGVLELAKLKVNGRYAAVEVEAAK